MLCMVGSLLVESAHGCVDIYSPTQRTLADVQKRKLLLLTTLNAVPFNMIFV